MSEQLTGVVVGLRMGRNHAAAMAGNEYINLAAVCDLSAETAAVIVDAVGRNGEGRQVLEACGRNSTLELTFRI